VTVIDRQINAEPIPGIAVAVLKVVPEPCPEIRGEAYIV
jgi:hypothetical protein